MHKKPAALFLCFALLIGSSSILGARNQNASPQCLDPYGRSVAWWVVIKTPGTLSDYFYRDANSPSCTGPKSGPCFGNVRNRLGEPNQGPLSRTLEQVYHRNFLAQAGYLMYNDDTSFPVKLSEQYNSAHAKGVIATDSNAGFWLLHSVPRFPKEDVGLSSYSGLTSNAKINAQSFLCISLAIDQMRIVGAQLRLANPFVYNKGGFNSSLLDALGADFESMLNGEHTSAIDPVQSAVEKLVATDGSALLSLSKSRNWGKDFYSDLAAPALDADLLVSSWSNGQGSFPTFCADVSCRSVRFPNRRNVCLPSCRERSQNCVFAYDIENVTEVRFNESIGWANARDHSKWAITSPQSKKNAVCVGDLNRQNGQRVRGGGAVCIQDENLWKAFHEIIGQADTCPETRSNSKIN